MPGKMFEGKVTRFSYALDDATKTMITEVELPNPQRELRPGMFATARMAVQTKANALVVPTDAVLVEKQKTSVFKVVDGKAKKVAVKVGFNDGTSVEILEGVNADDPIILVGKLPLNDGQAVQVTE
jgi:membrane fusion protein, multidrug efflux system